MKKLLVLTLIMGIASLATASLSLTIDGLQGETSTLDGAEVTGPVTINAVLFDSVTDYTLNVDVTGDLSLVTSTVEFEAGWLFGNGFTGGDPGDGALSAILSGGDFSPKAAGFGAFTGLGVVGTQGEIRLSEIGSGTGAAVITVIPEPATLALLGLGALVLRRKK